MDTLRIRAYNVRFGDAFLISVPDRENGQPRTRHILIDVGNSAATAGGTDVVFKPVVEDILKVLDGNPVDLYIMTHEHMDHIQGLLYAHKEDNLIVRANRSWLTASSEPGYYDRDWGQEKKPKEARFSLTTPPEQRRAMLAAYEELDAYLNGLMAVKEPIPPPIRAMWLNNSPRRTKDCVEHLRQRAPEDRTFYVHRETEGVADKHPFSEARIEIWAPEFNTTVYYGRLRPRTMALSQGRHDDDSAESAAPLPPPGVDAGAFYQLVDARNSSHIENLLAIDKAKNNSSVVFCLEWAGWRFLFPGDAEVKSWRVMEQEKVLKPVHFLKIGHHLSHNGTPEDEILEKILPETPPDGRKRLAVASTYPNTYHGIPFQPIVDRLAERGVPVHVIAEALGDFPVDEENVPFKGGFLEFRYPRDGSDPIVEQCHFDGPATGSN